ncbi:MAG: TolC family protein [Planctomycetota bacterium]
MTQSFGGRSRLQPILITAAALSVAGCLSPEAAVEDADKTAYDIIQQKQASALGTTRPFSIESPEDQLRRRLMIDQALPGAGPASFGREYLTPVPKEPAGVTGGVPLPESAHVASQRKVNVTGTRTPTIATDVFSTQIGTDPGSAAPAADPGFVGPIRLERATGDNEPEPVVLTLIDALKIGARNSRAYQTAKEGVFITALNLDFERDQFEFRFAGLLEADVLSELEGADTSGVVVSPSLSLDKAFKTGALLTTRIGLDLSQLLSGTEEESFGLFADASITVPLLQGAGVEIVTEPLQQAERNAIYSIWDFERFKREFAVDVATQYFSVLQSLDTIANSQANYDRLRYNAERSRAFFEEGELPGIQVDQAVNNELDALTRLISAEQLYEEQLDAFKVFLGLPPDATIELDPAELERLQPLAERVIGTEAMASIRLQSTTSPATNPGRADGDAATQPATRPSTRPTTGPATRPGTQSGTQPSTQPGRDRSSGENTSFANPLEDADRLFRDSAIKIALANRLDLSIEFAQVIDAQRAVVVAADGLEGVLDFSAGAAVGSSRGPFSGNLDNDLDLNFSDGTYSGGFRFDLPIERTAERNAYRVALIELDRAIRDAQEFEDAVKFDILSALRSIRVAAENLRIQAQAIRVAERRAAAANLLLELGRAEVRDVTEAEDALVDAQDGFTAALVSFYLSELELQRDLGVLEVNETGMNSTVLDLIGSPDS